MKLDDRISKAATEIKFEIGRQMDGAPMPGRDAHSDDWSAPSGGSLDLTLLAELVIRAAFPELFADPPTHKIVPLEPTEIMIEAGNNSGDWGPGTSISDDPFDDADPRSCYRAMVDAA